MDSTTVPLLSSGALTPSGSGRESPVHAGAGGGAIAGGVRRTSSWGGGLLSSAAGGEGDGGPAASRKPGQPVRETRAR